MQIDASVNYHVKKSTPQAFEFDVDGIVGNLVSPELIETKIKVTDLRGCNAHPQFDRDGIEFLGHVSAVEDFESGESWKAIYDQELTDLLKARIGAKEVIVFDHTVRIDDPQASRRPARNVHNDYNEKGAEQRLIDLVGEDRAQEFKQAGYGFVNVWRPVQNVIQSSPLGFIRPQSTKAGDWMDIGLIYPDRFGQILGVAANENHEWFYHSNMKPDEIVVFNIYDNRSRPHLAHSALDLPSDKAAATPRKSIESRTLVRYS
ncbi:CmcJ/NvfI family oxidoreductase [uncultured Erythrobacter sp.]|uniref:CmcJ/NvfI family oxidoreductase n=1 Tax=uncultured Erythrobacter sp. TaxID=263913 RepID=UPI00260FA2B0|nr:CmcJ/NvfI family oxidoreductase [uncultured Erythrobacter sp.]